MDRVRSQIGPVFGVDEEIDRIRGRDPAPLDLLAGQSVPGLLDVLARHSGDGPLLLDVDLPAVRAIVALFTELKCGEDRSLRVGPPVHRFLRQADGRA